jgi:hypothetical protein
MQLVYEASWSSYEEGGEIRIYVDADYSDMFYVHEGGTSVMAPVGEPYWQEPYLANEYDVSILKEQWDQIEKENAEYWDTNGGF